MKHPVWLPIEVILTIHEEQIAEHGGLPGVRDAAVLDSALARPKNAHAYGEEDACALAALYAAGIVKNHPFADGNKRTGYVACELFLLANGLALTAPDEECIAMTLALAAGEANAESYAAWLRDNVKKPR
jgi:death-on-curing protein